MRLCHAARIAIAGTAAAFIAGSAFAASGLSSGRAETVFIAEIVLILVVARVFGEIMQRWGQPSAMGQLIAGVVLGPSVFGLLFPHVRNVLFPTGPAQESMLNAVAQLGILMLLLLTGMETDIGLVRKVRMPAFVTALSSVVLPFALGFVIGEYLPASMLPSPGNRLVTALFLGTVLSISSIKIVAIVAREMHFLRRNLGQIIVASAIIEDTAGWIIISLTLAIAAHGRIEALPLAGSIAGVFVFLVACFTIGRPLAYLLIRWVNDTFQSEFAVVTAILVLMGAMALITTAIGVQSVLGAFMAGVLVGESPILTRHIDTQLRGVITALFVPVFFGVAGLGTDLTILAHSRYLLLTALLVLIASAGKFAGAWVGAKAGGLTNREALALGCAKNARGSTDVIVATIGLSAGAFTQNIFTMVVTMALITTMAMPPSLRWALARVPLREEERRRLEREEIDARGFVGRMERLLLAADDSKVGRLAARLAGLMAGALGAPLTFMEIPKEGSGTEAADVQQTAARDEAESALATGAAAAPAEETPSRHHVDVVTQKHGAASEDSWAQIARRGFDLLFVGTAGARTLGGQFTPRLTRYVRDVEAPLALLVAAQGKRYDLPRSGAHILVPVTGTRASRRGAEIAFVLARSQRAVVTVLYVSPSRESVGRRSRIAVLRRGQEAVLRDMVHLAARYDIDAHTAIETESLPEVPILRFAARADLIVMGVNRRPGELLFFGNTAAAVANASPCPILFVAE